MPSEKDYQRWLSQKIWVTGNHKESRRRWIPDFTQDITLWMQTRGYTMGASWGPKAVAKWLYAIQIQEVARKNPGGPLTYPEVKHRDWPEDRDVFEVYVTHNDILTFMERWRNIEDFDQGQRCGQRVLIELQSLLYTYIDMDSSKHGNRIARIMEEAFKDSDSENEYHAEIQDRQHNHGIW